MHLKNRLYILFLCTLQLAAAVVAMAALCVWHGRINSHTPVQAILSWVLLSIQLLLIAWLAYRGCNSTHTLPFGLPTVCAVLASACFTLAYGMHRLIQNLSVRTVAFEPTQPDQASTLQQLLDAQHNPSIPASTAPLWLLQAFVLSTTLLAVANALCGYHLGRVVYMTQHVSACCGVYVLAQQQQQQQQHQHRGESGSACSPTVVWGKHALYWLLHCIGIVQCI